MTGTVGLAPSAAGQTATPRRAARLAGGLYLLTFVTSIPALALKGPVLHDAGFVLGAGSHRGVLWAVVLEVVLAAACVGTAVVLFPVVRRWSEPAALGFVAARVLEGAIIVLGALSLLAVVALRQDLAATAPPASLLAAAASLVAVHDGAFLLGPGFLPAVNAALLGSVLYRSGLVPRVIPATGLVGAPLLTVSAVLTVFGVTEQVSVFGAIGALPIALWELSLGVWLVAKGFRPSTVAGPGATDLPSGGTTT